MIRRALSSGYNRIAGLLKGAVGGRISGATRSGGLLQFLYVILVVGLMAGFINAVFFPVANQGYVPYPSGGAETIPEAILDGFVILMGGAGIYLAYISGRQTTRTRTVNLYLGIGLLLIVVSMFTGIDLAILKGFG